MRKTRYHDMLRAYIWEHVSYSTCPTLESMISRAREKEIDIEHLRKRKVETEQGTEVSGKKPKGFDSKLKGHQGRRHCGKCGKPHEGHVD